MSFIDRLVRHWNLADDTPDVDRAANAIDLFEAPFRVALPADVRSFYLRFNAHLVLEMDEMDSDLNSFWPIEEVDRVPSKIEGFAGIPDYSGISASLPDANSYFAFADHSIWVMVYAMRLTSDRSSPARVIYIADGNTYATIADSFAAFWESYLENPSHIP